MNKIPHLIYKSIAVCSLLFLTGCFEILEEIKLNKDGSGEVVFTLNMSQSKTKLASIILMDSINGYKIPDKEEINEALLKVTDHLKTTPGISNVKKILDYENFIFQISCSFSKIENINDVALRAQKKYKTKEISESDTKGYTYNKGNTTFMRYYNYNSKVKDEFSKLESADKDVVDNAMFISIYRFENDVVSTDNPNAKISKSKKAVMLRSTILDLINGNKRLNNKIKLTN